MLVSEPEKKALHMSSAIRMQNSVVSEMSSKGSGCMECNASSIGELWGSVNHTQMTTFDSQIFTKQCLKMVIDQY
jgi:hypothetical protein